LNNFGIRDLRRHISISGIADFAGCQSSR